MARTCSARSGQAPVDPDRFHRVLSGEVGSEPPPSAVVAAEVPAELAGPEIVEEPALPWPDAGLAVEDDGPPAAITGQQHGVVGTVLALPAVSEDGAANLPACPTAGVLGGCVHLGASFGGQ